METPGGVGQGPGGLDLYGIFPLLPLEVLSRVTSGGLWGRVRFPETLPETRELLSLAF